MGLRASSTALVSFLRSRYARSRLCQRVNATRSWGAVVTGARKGDYFVARLTAPVAWCSWNARASLSLPPKCPLP